MGKFGTSLYSSVYLLTPAQKLNVQAIIVTKMLSIKKKELDMLIFVRFTVYKT